MNYSSLNLTTEVSAVCYTCSDYDGMVDCTECGMTFCVTCADGCDACGADIDWSK